MERKPHNGLYVCLILVSARNPQLCENKRFRIESRERDFKIQSISYKVMGYQHGLSQQNQQKAFARLDASHGLGFSTGRAGRGAFFKWGWGEWEGIQVYLHSQRGSPKSTPVSISVHVELILLKRCAGIKKGKRGDEGKRKTGGGGRKASTGMRGNILHAL